MDWLNIPEKIFEWGRKYRYILLILLVGLLLLTLPEQETSEPVSEPTVTEGETPDLQKELSEILSHVSGAGKVEVLLTPSAGEEIVYQTDEDRSETNIRRETVIVTRADREDVGLIKQINPPVYQGAIVVCEGADSAQVCLSIVEAVMSVTGLTSDHITVLKMK